MAYRHHATQVCPNFTTQECYHTSVPFGVANNLSWLNDITAKQLLNKSADKQGETQCAQNVNADDVGAADFLSP